MTDKLMTASTADLVTDITYPVQIAPGLSADSYDQSLRLFVTRELACRDVADGTDSTADVLEICGAFPAEAGKHVDAYASATRLARAVANGEWPVSP